MTYTLCLSLNVVSFMRAKPNISAYIFTMLRPPNPLLKYIARVTVFNSHMNLFKKIRHGSSGLSTQRNGSGPLSWREQRCLIQSWRGGEHS